MIDDLTKSEIVYIIENRVVGRNAERNQQILYDKLIRGYTYDRIAEDYQLSVVQIKNIIYKHKKLFEKHT